jgi:hypothetical protein
MAQTAHVVMGDSRIAPRDKIVFAAARGALLPHQPDARFAWTGSGLSLQRLMG